MKSDTACKIKAIINNTILTINIYAGATTFVKYLFNILINGL